MSRLAGLLLLFWLASCAHARADDVPIELGSPYAPLVREHYYQQLQKNPWRALGWELLAPGFGNFYTGVHAPAAATLGLSLAGAGLWIAGAVRDRPALLWTGVSTFAGARVFGLVSAPVGALLLNAAFRRQLGVSATY